MSIRSSFPSISPSLTLDFAKSRRLDPRVTFTRAQTGNVSTYTGSDGLINYAGPDEPRFEYRSTFSTNSLAYSEDFSQSSWIKISGTTVTSNQITAPDGLLTADLINDTGENGISQSVSGTIYNGKTIIASVFLKRGSAFSVRIRQIDESGDPGHHVVFNLNTLTFSDLSNVLGYGYTNEGNDWYRVWMRYTTSRNGASITIRSNTGTAANFYAWGAQLEEGNAVTSYIATGPNSITRMRTESLGLLIEQARTNYIPHSTFGAGWANNEPAVGAGAAAQIITNTTEVLSPDGTNNAAKIIQANNGWQRVLIGVSTATNNRHTWSLFVKYGNSPMCVIELTGNWNAGGRIQWNFNTETFSEFSSGFFTNLTFKKYPNGWYRLSGDWLATSNVAQTGTAWFFPGDDYNGLPTSPASYTYAYGYQIEEGVYPTSYIPTSGSTVTRSEDWAYISGSNFSKWFNSAEWSLGIESRIERSTLLSAPGGKNQLRFRNSANLYGSEIRTVSDLASPYLDAHGTLPPIGAVQFDFNGTSPSFPETFKAFLSVKLNDAAFCFNRTVQNDNTVTPFTADYINLCEGPTVSRISKITYYPKRLTSEQLQSLTTLQP